MDVFNVPEVILTSAVPLLLLPLNSIIFPVEVISACCVVKLVPPLISIPTLALPFATFSGLSAPSA